MESKSWRFPELHIAFGVFLAAAKVGGGHHPREAAELLDGLGSNPEFVRVALVALLQESKNRAQQRVPESPFQQKFIQPDPLPEAALNPVVPLTLKWETTSDTTITLSEGAEGFLVQIVGSNPSSYSQRVRAAEERRNATRQRELF